MTDTTVYIDADVFVASEIKTESNHKESKKFIDYVLANKRSNMKFFTSIFTFLELASAMMRRTKSKDRAYSLLYRITGPWKRAIKPIAPTRKKIGLRALVDTLIETSIRFNTPSGDTIHAQTFAENEINLLVTWNVKDFSGLKKEIKEIKILTPTEALTEFEIINKKFDEEREKRRLDFFKRFRDRDRLRRIREKERASSYRK